MHRLVKQVWVKNSSCVGLNGQFVDSNCPLCLNRQISSPKSPFKRTLGLFDQNPFDQIVRLTHFTILLRAIMTFLGM
jgi:hypothetical protein